MPSNKREVFGPIALTNSVANLIAPAAAGGSAVGYTATASYILIYRILVANKTGSPATVTLYKGATGGSAAGTEIAVSKTVPANDQIAIDFPGGLRLEGTNGFLTGLASASTTLVLTATGEVGLV